MGRAFEYRKARKLKRWGHMARVFTKIGKEIDLPLHDTYITSTLPYRRSRRFDAWEKGKDSGLWTQHVAGKGNKIINKSLPTQGGRLHQGSPSRKGLI